MRRGEGREEANEETSERRIRGDGERNK
jgi:hypothetical protein